jgi:hypothetical protein
MRPMEQFDPDRPCRVHDRVNDRTFVWRPSWASDWQRHARIQDDGTVEFDGLILDRWEGFRPDKFQRKAAGWNRKQDLLRGST